jgi:hypothetical protein
VAPMDMSWGAALKGAAGADKLATGSSFLSGMADAAGDAELPVPVTATLHFNT